MKSRIKFPKLLIIFVSFIILFSCEKEFNYGRTEKAVKTLEFSDVLQTSAMVSGTILTDNGASLFERGICYGMTENPTVSDYKIADPSAILGDFICLLDNLSPGTTYYARAYATNMFGTAYGNSVSFTTQAATIPILSVTTAANLITSTSAKSGGIITNSGASNVTSRGICWSSSIAIPTIAGTKTNDGTGTGAFISTLTGLSPNTLYYIRAYATNSIGTGYGDVKTFTTSTATIPTGITTTILTVVTQTTASGGGIITSDGGSVITSRGVCWSNSTTTPTTANTKTIDGTGIGQFTSSIIGLTPGTTYYVRAYATNSVGTAYGTVKTFTTSPATVPSGITTTAISAVTQTTASGGGSIISDGGSSITSRGVCWSNTTTTPTITNTKTIDGTGVGSFTSLVTGLSPNTVYYLRAYATNSVGTAYGNMVSFTTLPNLTVGQTYQGGIIAYIFIPGDAGYVTGQTHGLITTTTNQSTGVQWGCSGTSISTSTIIGTGQNNTTAIVNNCITTNIAARICDNLSFGGYTDWFLPSRDELNKLYLNRTIIGGFSNVSYWSSSQNVSTTAWYINFSSGALTSSSKTGSFYVRAVRRF